MSEYRSASGSSAEDLFIELLADTFGAEKAGYLYKEVTVVQICSQLMHGVLSFKFDFIIWRIRQLLAQDKLVLVKQGMCDQCYGKPFEHFIKSIVRINEKT